MFQHNLNMLKDAKIMRVENSAVAGTSTLVSDIVDMRGYDSICFVAILGDVTSGSVLELHAKENSANSTSGSTELAGNAGGTAGASDADNKLLVLDVQKPRERYVYCELERASQNAVVDGIIAILYNSHERPLATQDSTVYDSESINDADAAA